MARAGYAAPRTPTRLTGRANALTRGKGKKTGLKRVMNTSSAASSFSKAQKRSYAALNSSRSATIATNRARKAATSGAGSTMRASIPRVTPQWQLFGGIGDAIRKATGGR